MMTASARATATGSIETALAHASGLLAEHPDEALAQAREILRVAPAHPHARFIEAKALRLCGDVEGAHAILAPLAAAQPRSAMTHAEVGALGATLGDRAMAMAGFRRATELKPDEPRYWSAFGAALREAGREAEADRADLAAVRAATNDPVLVKAAIALGEGRFAVAEPLLRDRLRQRPDDVAATRMLGELAWRIGRVEDAAVLLRRTLTLAPGFDAARELLARLLARSNAVPEALAHATHLVAAAPDHPGHAMLKASLLVRVGDQAGARAIYEALLERQPRQPRIWLNLGHVLKTIGEQAGAVAAYRRAAAISATLGEAWWSLANLKTVKLDAADVAAMRAALAVADAGEDAFHLHFALGKALEDLGDDAAAFDHYAHGNRLRREALPYDADALHAQTRAHIACFDRAFLGARADGGCAAPDPVFIVGLPRAGSTLIEQILASHSQVEGTMELPDLMMIAERLEARAAQSGHADVTGLLATLDPDERLALGEEYLERARAHRHTDKPFFTDKMPNNWQHVGLIQLILPNARIVDARRHPVGGCFSAWKQHFARGQAFSYDLVDVGRYYRDYVAQMAAFDAAAPGRVHRVIYERMVADARGEVERLLAHLGLPFEETCLSFWKTERAVRTASSEQVRTPIFTDAVDHWRRFEPYLTPLIGTLGTVADRYPEVPAELRPS